MTRIPVTDIVFSQISHVQDAVRHSPGKQCRWHLVILPHRFPVCLNMLS